MPGLPSRSVSGRPHAVGHPTTHPAPEATASAQCDTQPATPSLRPVRVAGERERVRLARRARGAPPRGPTPPSGRGPARRARSARPPGRPDRCRLPNAFVARTSPWTTPPPPPQDAVGRLGEQASQGVEPGRRLSRGRASQGFVCDEAGRSEDVHPGQRLERARTPRSPPARPARRVEPQGVAPRRGRRSAPRSPRRTRTPALEGGRGPGREPYATPPSPRSPATQGRRAQIAEQSVDRAARRLHRLEDPRQRGDGGERIGFWDTRCFYRARVPILATRGDGSPSADHRTRTPGATLTHEALENLLHEERRFPPSRGVRGPGQRDRGAVRRRPRADRLGFWAEQAGRLHWDRPWDRGPRLVRRRRSREWFVGGRLNVADNCVDRHVDAGHGDQVAIHFEGEPGDTRDVTYADLQREVCQAANALTELGVQARATGSRSTCR